MKISIIIPVFNAESYIERCINSILIQTYQNWELILVNDGSTDTSLQLCKKYHNIDNRIIVIDKVNEGVSKARNLGIKIAKGEYITFIDADDYVEKDFLASLICYKSFDFVSLSHRRFGKENCIKTLDKDYSFSLPNNFSNIISQKNNISLFILYPWAKLFKVDIIKRFKIQFCENLKLAEDSLFVITYLSYCKCAIFLANVQYDYYIVQSVSKKYMFDYETYEKHKKYYHKELEFIRSRVGVKIDESTIQAVYFMNYLEYLYNTQKTKKQSGIFEKIQNLKFFGDITLLVGKKRTIALYWNYLIKG